MSVIPNNNYKLNQETIIRITNDGVELGTEINIEFSFRGNQDDIFNLKQILQAEGFFIDNKQSSKDNIFFNKLVKLDINEINKIDEYLYLLAEKSEVEYDGWGTMVE